MGLAVYTSSSDPCQRHRTQDERHRTPLHLAVEIGAIEMIQTLLENNSNPNAKDHQENSPLMVTCHILRHIIVQTLLRQFEIIEFIHDKAGLSSALLVYLSSREHYCSYSN